MSLPGVKTTIKDGALGITSSTGVGTYAAVGVASTADAATIHTFTSADQVEAKIGYGPLRDLLVNGLSIFSNTVYAIAVPATVDGTASAVAKGTDNASNAVGTVAVKNSSKPHAAYSIKVTITKDGALGTARAHITIGDKQHPQFTLPAGGDHAVGNTGITLTFANGAPSGNQVSFKALDTFSLTTTAPTTSNANITAAVNTLINSAYSYEFIAVAGATDKTLWGAIATAVEAAATKHKYIFALAQARPRAANETTDAYVTALTGAERGTTEDKRLAVTAAYISLTDAIEGTTRTQPLINVLPALIARRQVHEGADAVKYGAIPAAQTIAPANLNDGHIQSLMDSGYITVRIFPYKKGIYITLAVLTTAAGSDFDTLEKIRVINKTSAQARASLLQYINDTVAIAADDVGLEHVKLTVGSQLNIMKTAGEISDYDVIIPAGQDILATKTLKLTIRIVPLGKLTYIENTITFHNPTQGGTT